MVVLLVWILLSALVAYLGRDRVIGFWGFLVLSLLVSPPVVLLALLVTQPKMSTATE